MTIFKKIVCSIFFLTAINSCGKKSGLTYLGDEAEYNQRFQKSIEGYGINNDSDKNFKYYYDIKGLAAKKKKISTAKNPEPLVDLHFTKKTSDKEGAQQNSEGNNQQP